MKVDPMVPDDPMRNAPVVPPATAAETTPVAQTAAVQSYAAAAVPSGDRASVSKTASELSAAVRAMPKDSGASSERLDALRGAVRTGAMPVDIMALADAILRDEGVNS